MTGSLIATAKLREALQPGITLLHEIRAGGQRAVYAVEVDGARRVLKLMPTEAIDRAEREVTIGQRFEHPGLARILSDLNEIEVDSERFLYFTEELIEGEPLDEVQGPMGICEALALAIQLVDATEHLYLEHRVVHRDVKPKNIMRRPDGSFALLDVGVGRHQGLDTLTATGADHGPGTRGYLAPEQLQASKGHELDWRADQFSIAIVTFEQLSGRLPFDPRSSSYRTLLMTGTVVGWDEVPAEARSVLGRMLSAKPHRRYRLGRATEELQNAKEQAAC